jgi:hypothetical protein
MICVTSKEHVWLAAAEMQAIINFSLGLVITNSAN